MFRVAFSIILFFFFPGCFIATGEDESLFIQQYDLLKLDGQPCDNCILDVQDGNVYKIIVNGEEVGKGKWKLEHPLDFPGYVLKLEHGPNWMIYEH